MRCMPARPTRPEVTTTSARAATALPPIVRTPVVLLVLVGLPASPARLCSRFRWAGCIPSEIDCFLLACGNLGGRRKTSAFLFRKQIRIEAFVHRIAHRPRVPCAGYGGVHLQGRGYGLCRWKAIQLGRVEKNPRQSRSPAKIEKGRIRRRGRPKR